MKATLLTVDNQIGLYGEGVSAVLISGVFCETLPAGQDHDRAAANLVVEIRYFTKPRRLGPEVASNSGVWLERRPDTGSEPDIAFTSADKIQSDLRVCGYSEFAPEPVVDSVSPRTNCGEVDLNTLTLLSYGVDLFRLVNPEICIADLSARECAASIHVEDDTRESGRFLPDSSCSLSDIFDA